MEIERFFPYQLAVAAAALSRQLEDVYRRDGGLTREEWRVLFLLADVDGFTSKEVAQRSSLDKVQISRAAARLEDKGLISSTTSAKDRRLRDYACTDKGRAFFQELFPQVDARAASVLSRMSAEDLAALEQGVAGLLKAARDAG